MKFNVLYLVYTVLIAFNAATVYFIIELSSYSEMLKYNTDGTLQSTTPRLWIAVFLTTGVANLLFVCASFMRSIIFSK